MQGMDVYVWSGMFSSQNQRSWAMLKAEELLQEAHRPKEATVCWVMDGSELPYFRSQVSIFGDELILFFLLKGIFSVL
jgi:hypothetical protein